MTVAFLNPTIPPRVVSLLNFISEHSVNVHAVFFAVSQQNRRWDLESKDYDAILFKYTVLKSSSLGFGLKDFHNTFVSLEIFSVLKKINPDIVVLPGWADITSLFALWWAKKNNRKVILRSESTAHEASWRRTLFKPIITWALNNSDMIIGSSTRAADFASTLTSTPQKVIYSSFDTRKFSKLVSDLRVKRQKLLKKHRINQSKVVLFCGQLIERKGVHELLRAFASTSLDDIALVLVGYGPLLATVQAAADKRSNIYCFTGVDYSDLPEFYALSDVFILPSYEETWGLVVIEAMAAGLPVITTKYAGSSELIEDGKNGYVLDDVKPALMIDALNKAFKKQKSLGKVSQKIAIKTLAYELIARQFYEVFCELEELDRALV